MPKIKVGQPAPDFSLSASDGKTYSLRDFRGKSAVVLYFYPKDFTPGCTIEACSFRDVNKDIKKAGAFVLGVSSDSVESHKKMAQKHRLNFPLLADTEKKVLKKYGVWQQKKFLGREYMGIVRTTFLIDKKGEVVKVWEKVNPRGHEREVLQALKDL